MDQDILRNTTTVQIAGGEEPLVSIIVITYNSAKYVIETLDSAKVQSYQNIELIISDDGSTDKTVEICCNWIAENNKRFVRTELITAKKNNGISANCNHGVKVSTGVWLKLIAGDDVLDSECLKSNFPLFLEEQVNLICSTIYEFESSTNISRKVWPSFKFPTDMHSQLKMQLIGSFIRAPGVFIRSKLYSSLNGFDIEYPFLEDDPFWIKALNNQVKFFYNPDSKVYYRINSGAITRNGNIDFFNIRFIYSLISFRKKVVLPLLMTHRFYFWFLLCKTEVYTIQKIIDNGNNLKNLRCQTYGIILRIIGKSRHLYFNLVGKFSAVNESSNH